MTPRRQTGGYDPGLPEGWRSQIVYPEGFKTNVEDLDRGADFYEFSAAMDADFNHDVWLWKDQHPEWVEAKARRNIAWWALGSLAFMTALYAIFI